MTNVIEFPAHRAAVVQRASQVAKETCFNLAQQMRDDLLVMGLPVWHDPKIQKQISAVVDQYRQIVLDFYNYDEEISLDLDEPTGPSPFPQDEKEVYTALHWDCNLTAEEEKEMEQFVEYMSSKMLDRDEKRIQDSYNNELDAIIKKLTDYEKNNA